mmetsp:Transcript_46847/g.102444  ORF Transcript_46847/g.102444 Transcript_46847/m.102444 type:complete len:608 (-) Transcript_46847:1250-3073(-)
MHSKQYHPCWQPKRTAEPAVVSSQQIEHVSIWLLRNGDETVATPPPSPVLVKLIRARCGVTGSLSLRRLLLGGNNGDAPTEAGGVRVATMVGAAVGAASMATATVALGAAAATAPISSASAVAGAAAGATTGAAAVAVPEAATVAAAAAAAEAAAGAAVVAAARAATVAVAAAAAVTATGTAAAEFGAEPAKGIFTRSAACTMAGVAVDAEVGAAMGSSTGFTAETGSGDVLGCKDQPPEAEKTSACDTTSRFLAARPVMEAWAVVGALAGDIVVAAAMEQLEAAASAVAAVPSSCMPPKPDSKPLQEEPTARSGAGVLLPAKGGLGNKTSCVDPCMQVVSNDSASLRLSGESGPCNGCGATDASSVNLCVSGEGGSSSADLCITVSGGEGSGASSVDCRVSSEGGEGSEATVAEFFIPNEGDNCGRASRASSADRCTSAKRGEDTPPSAAISLSSRSGEAVGAASSTASNKINEGSDAPSADFCVPDTSDDGRDVSKGSSAGVCTSAESCVDISAASAGISLSSRSGECNGAASNKAGISSKGGEGNGTSSASIRVSGEGSDSFNASSALFGVPGASGEGTCASVFGVSVSSWKGCEGNGAASARV